MHQQQLTMWNRLTEDLKSKMRQTSFQQNVALMCVMSG